MYIKLYKIHLIFAGCNFLLIHVFCLCEFEVFWFSKKGNISLTEHWEKLLHISELFEIILSFYVINRPCELGLETENLDFCSALKGIAR